MYSSSPLFPSHPIQPPPQPHLRRHLPSPPRSIRPAQAEARSTRLSLLAPETLAQGHDGDRAPSPSQEHAHLLLFLEVGHGGGSDLVADMEFLLASIHPSSTWRPSWTSPQEGGAAPDPSPKKRALTRDGYE